MFPGSPASILVAGTCLLAKPNDVFLSNPRGRIQNRRRSRPFRFQRPYAARSRRVRPRTPYKNLISLSDSFLDRPPLALRILEAAAPPFCTGSCKENPLPTNPQFSFGIKSFSNTFFLLLRLLLTMAKAVGEGNYSAKNTTRRPS